MGTQNKETVIETTRSDQGAHGMLPFSIQPVLGLFVGYGSLKLFKQ